MLYRLSKISYKFSTNALFILFSILADLLLSSEDYGKFVIIMSIQVLIYNLSDYFNTKYLLGKFSKHKAKTYLSKILNTKIYYGLIVVLLLSLVYFWYGIDKKVILLLVLANYTQIISSTVATYIFTNEHGHKLFLSNFAGAFACSLYLMIFYFLEKHISLNSIIIGFLIYRAVELIYLYFKTDINLSKKSKINYTELKEVFPFYMQLVLSIGSSKLFMLYLPFLLSFMEIALIGAYEYMIAIPLFFVSILTMLTYSELFKRKLDIVFDSAVYRDIMKRYYIQSTTVLFFFMIIQLLYIKYFKVELLPYITFVILHDIALVFTAIQGYLLFFWKMNRLIIFISLFVLVIKNVLMFLSIEFYGILGYFVTTIFIEYIILIYLKIKVDQAIKNRIQSE